jgi:hypothetical protein
MYVEGKQGGAALVVVAVLRVDVEARVLVVAMALFCRVEEKLVVDALICEREDEEHVTTLAIAATVRVAQSWSVG